MMRGSFERVLSGCLIALASKMIIIPPKDTTLTVALDMPKRFWVFPSKFIDVLSTSWPMLVTSVGEGTL